MTQNELKRLYKLTNKLIEQLTPSLSPETSSRDIDALAAASTLMDYTTGLIEEREESTDDY